MAKLKTHCEDCKSLLGSEFRKVHEWLDRDVEKHPPELYFEKHRIKTHCLEAIRGLATEQERLAAKIHIIRDVELYVLLKSFYKVSLDEIDGLFLEALKWI